MFKGRMGASRQSDIAGRGGTVMGKRGSLGPDAQMRSVKSNGVFAGQMGRLPRATTAEGASPRFHNDADPNGVAFYGHPPAESKSTSKLGADFQIKQRNMNDSMTPKTRKGKPVFAADRETRAERVARLTGKVRMRSDHR